MKTESIYVLAYIIGYAHYTTIHSPVVYRFDFLRTCVPKVSTYMREREKKDRAHTTPVARPPEGEHAIQYMHTKHHCTSSKAASRETPSHDNAILIFT